MNASQPSPFLPTVAVGVGGAVLVLVTGLHTPPRSATCSSLSWQYRFGPQGGWRGKVKAPHASPSFPTVAVGVGADAVAVAYWAQRSENVGKGHSVKPASCWRA